MEPWARIFIWHLDGDSWGGPPPDFDEGENLAAYLVREAQLAQECGRVV